MRLCVHVPRTRCLRRHELNTPAGAALLSSEALNVLTLPAPCVTVAESVSDNAGERDGEEDDDDSDNDLEIVSEQLERMKTVRIFNPMHVLGNKISESDIDGLKIFKFYEHPEIRPQIAVMKTEFTWYQDLTDSIKSFEERKDNKGKDTFDLSDWWKSNCATHPFLPFPLYLDTLLLQGSFVKLGLNR